MRSFEMHNRYSIVLSVEGVAGLWLAAAPRKSAIVIMFFMGSIENAWLPHILC